MPKRVSTYLTDRSLEIAGAGDSLSGGINRSLDRYGEILRRARIDERFTPAEMDCIRDVCTGWLAEPAATIAGGIGLELLDSIPDGIGEKWGVDVRALAARVDALPFADQIALVESIERR